MSINLEAEASPLCLFDKTFWPMADATDISATHENRKEDDVGEWSVDDDGELSVANFFPHS